MNRIYSIFFSICILVLSLSAHGQSGDMPVKTIPSLDVQRYLGVWYEIAKYPNWFQKKCVSNTKAVSSVRTDGTLKV